MYRLGSGRTVETPYLTRSAACLRLYARAGLVFWYQQDSMLLTNLGQGVHSKYDTGKNSSLGILTRIWPFTGGLGVTAIPQKTA